MKHLFLGGYAHGKVYDIPNGGYNDQYLIPIPGGGDDRYYRQKFGDPITGAVRYAYLHQSVFPVDAGPRLMNFLYAAWINNDLERLCNE